jgi:hypothetical protein
MELKIMRDDEPASNPRDCENLGVIACWHRRYALGDVRPQESSTEWLKANAPKGSIVLPVFMFDHSGITISTSSERFQAADSMRWDWGQLGNIVATPDNIKKVFGVKKLTEGVLAKARAALEGEIKVYDQYLRGEVWGYEFTGDDGEVDSCWGFLGETLEETGIADQVPDAAKPLLQAAWAARQ